MCANLPERRNQRCRANKTTQLSGQIAVLASSSTSCMPGCMRVPAPATLQAHLAASSEKSTGQLQQTAHPSPSISSSWAELGYRPSASHSSSHSRAPLVARPAGRSGEGVGPKAVTGNWRQPATKSEEQKEAWAVVLGSNSRADVFALAYCAPTHLSSLRRTGLPGMPAPARQSPALRPPGQHAGLAARSCCLPQRQAGGAAGTAPAASQQTSVLDTRCSFEPDLIFALGTKGL